MICKALICGGLSLCAAACASSPSTPAARPRATAAAQLPPAGCVSKTGTRIPLGPTECAAAGHIWTEGAIKSTGATDPSEALRLLDPTVTVGH
jgi:hypothetical protein